MLLYYTIFLGCVITSTIQCNSMLLIFEIHDTSNLEKKILNKYPHKSKMSNDLF